MRKTIAILVIVFLVLFMVGCENSNNPINSDNPTTTIVQSENATKRAVMPFGGEGSTIVSQEVRKPAKPAKPNKWNVPGDFDTIQEAIDDDGVADDDIIQVGKGEHAGALVTKGVHIIGNAGKTIINTGLWHSGANTYLAFIFLTGSDGASLSYLEFTTSGLDIMNSASVNNVEIHHCDFNNSLQAISNWGGSGWNIHHNNLVDLRTHSGGGIGIFIGDYAGGVVENNIVMHNKISGILNVWENDGGGYCGTGIVIYADFRYNRDGSEALKNNIVEHNKVSLISDNPEVVDAVGIELTDTSEDEDPPFDILIYDNVIRFNDLRGTLNSIELTPTNLGDYNDISKNHVN